MTKHDFAEIAAIIATVKNQTRRIWMAVYFARELTKQHEKFDHVKFLMACDALFEYPPMRCEHCKKYFTPQRSNKIYCSLNCRVAAFRERQNANDC